MLRRILLASVLSVAALPAVAAGSGAPFFASPANLNWSGFYLGVNAGYGWGNQKLGDYTYGPGFFSCGGACSFSTDKATFGATLGYNVQVGNVVFGVEGDQNWFNSKGGLAPLNYFGEISSFGTFRGRLGYAVGAFLPYLTGGLYWQNSKITLRDPSGDFSASKTFFGWTGGAGVEYAFTNNWSVKGEYLYARPEDLSYSYGIGTSKNRAHLHIVRAGVNYRF